VSALAAGIFGASAKGEHGIKLSQCTRGMGMLLRNATSARNKMNALLPSEILPSFAPPFAHRGRKDKSLALTQRHALLFFLTPKIIFIDYSHQD
jgi:hypothetical protein